MTKEGTVLDGKYEILAEVGRGGMSIVYLARDKRLNKQWAVKEIKNDGKKSAKTLLKGLEREANILKNVGAITKVAIIIGTARFTPTALDTSL